MATTLAASILGAGAPAGANEAAFACEPGFYQVISGQLAELDPANEAYSLIGPANSNYNAMGYRIADGYLYGMSGTTLHRIDSSGTRTDIATLDMAKNSYAGDFDDEGLLNVSRGGRDWHKINVDTFEVTPVPEFSSYTAVADITNVHGVFYGVSSDGALYAYDQTTGDSREVGLISGLPETLKAYGAAWSTAGGNLYVGRNSGEIYQITGYTTSNPKATLVGSAPATASNDGGACPLAVPPAGLDDVDGPAPESAPRTEAAQKAAQYYEENYDEISKTFTPASAEPEPQPEIEPTDGSTYSFENAGMGTGPSCDAGGDVDRPERVLTGDLIAVNDRTELYNTTFNSDSLNQWTIRSGSWTSTTGSLKQNNICGYDYTALLDTFSVEDFSWQASFAGISNANNGGLIFNHSSTRSRSGAVVVDLTNDGGTVRWGEYDERGYYQLIGSVETSKPSAGQNVTLGVEVHGNVVVVTLDGAQLGTFESTEVGGMVGLISSVSQVSFSNVSLVALPAQTGTGR